MPTYRSRTNDDGSTSIQVQIRIKGFPLTTATFERKVDATQWAVSTEAAMREGRRFPERAAARRTVGQLIERYVSEVLPHKTDKASQGPQLRWWSEALGTIALRDLTPGAIGAARERLAHEAGAKGKPRKPATINRYLAALSHALSVATNEWGWLESSPMRKVRRRKEPEGRIRFLNQAELARMLKACEASSEPQLYAYFMVSLATGQRRAEVLRLRYPDHVDLERGLASVTRSKNQTRRATGLAKSATKAIRVWLKVRGEEPGPLFTMSTTVLRDRWAEACAAAGVDDFHVHDIRHCTASYLAMKGASPIEIADVLGHKTLQMVRRYAHLYETHTAPLVRSTIDDAVDAAVTPRRSSGGKRSSPTRGKPVRRSAPTGRSS